ncbi:MAG: DEAD/DEAH box helicase [Burkholderiaceae bacterium]|nr:DEAD/DEAH box helicase [Burkholderiaceae bacterium]
MNSYGQISYRDSAWLIAGEPFVKTRLKRVFPRAPQEAADVIRLSATPENTRELQWFLQRYPMDIDRPDVLERLAGQHIETERRLADLMTGRAQPGAITLAEPPRQYQEFAAALLEVKPGYLLADDLGLGKTVSAICPMVKPANLPALVVCPAHLPRQWKAMLKRFAPALNVHVLKKGTPYDLTPKRRGRKNEAQAELLPPELPDVIVTSYHKLRGWAETLAGIVKYVVFDECQALRSPGTGIHVAADYVAARAERRLGLSATPIYNYGHEFYHVVSVLAPDCLGEYSEFLREWCTAEAGGKARLADAKEFGAYLRREGIMLRRTRAEVGRELPELSKIVHEVDADAAALDALRSDAVALAKIVLRHNEQFRGEKMQAAGEFDALMRQATGIAKAPYVAEFVKLLLDSGEPIVLFGWHRAVYSIWLEALAEFNPVLYTGTESANQKAEAISAFLSGEARVMIMSLRSGAGVDGLQGYCSTVVFGELDWSPGVHEQCIGRVHRDGQGEPCSAYFLVADSGADPIMAEVLGVKREQIESVRNPDMALAERIDTGENNIQRLARDFLARRGEKVIAEPANVVVMAERVTA